MKESLKYIQYNETKLTRGKLLNTTTAKTTTIMTLTTTQPDRQQRQHKGYAYIRDNMMEQTQPATV